MSRNGSDLKDIPLVEITWFDAIYTTDYWLLTDEIKNIIKEYKIMRTVGYEVIENPNFHIICQSLSNDNKYGGYFMIPKGCVRKIRLIKGSVHK